MTTGTNRRRSAGDLKREQIVLNKVQSTVERVQLTPAGYESLVGTHDLERFRAARDAERSGWIESGTVFIKGPGRNYTVIGARVRFIRHRDDGTVEEKKIQILTNERGELVDQYVPPPQIDFAPDSAVDLPFEPQPIKGKP